jgi:Xaa-Pro aminopeptidase
MLKTKISPVYFERRKKLMAVDPSACFIFFGAGVFERNYDVEYPFRQESNFHYFTEFDEQDAALLLVGGKSHLFVLSRDPDREIWDGDRYGLERAKDVFQVDETHLVSDFYSQLGELLVDAKKVYYDLGHDSQRDAQVIAVVKKAAHYLGRGSVGKFPIFDPAPLLSKMRLVKDPFEIEMMRKATSISARAHLALLKRVRAGMTEFEASAEFNYYLFKNGCTSIGYNPIFASGVNATTLHYFRNNEVLKHGDLLLVDAGGDLNNYTADITQTFPISGTFSSEQKKIYEKVLSVNRAVAAMVKPGVSYRNLHTASVDLITEALLSLGVLTGSISENVLQKTYRKYYPHGLGHYLGLDVHDAGIYDEHVDGNPIDLKLEAGMLITVEPGLYFRDKGAPFSGIGVRIEDDVLVTANGADVLTHELPREVEAIENLRTIANS